MNGFVLSLKADEPTFHLPGPILVTLRLINVSGKEQRAVFGSLHSDYTFTIRNQETGETVPANPHNTFGGFAGSVSSKGWAIAPGDSFSGDFRLDLLYTFTKPGSYLVKVTRGTPGVNGHNVTMTSNTITIELLSP